jgi:hypothetical protein
MAIEIPYALRLARLVVPLAMIAGMIWAASASASVRSCSYRNMTRGAVPYVSHVRTNLTSAAVGGANVCTVVSEVVERVQQRGFDLGAGPALIDPGEPWALDHHLVYPRGWPQPTGPIYDPHMHVTLHMLTRRPAQQAHPVLAARSRNSRYWIQLNEYS